MATGIRVNDNTAEDSIIAALIGGMELDYILGNLTGEDFSNNRNTAIYNEVAARYTDGQVVDIVSMQPRLTGLHLLNAQEYFTFVKIYGDLPKTSIPSYVQRLKASTQRKELARLMNRIGGALQEQEPPEKIWESLEKELILKSATGHERTLITPSEMAMGCLEAVSNRMDAEKRRASVVNTSFPSLNWAIGGFEKGDLVILSAESGAGKSAFSMNIARDTGVTLKRPCLYMNSEMTTEQQELRWASFLSGVSHSAIREGKINACGGDDDYKKISDSLTGMLHSKLYTLNMPDMQISGVLSEIRLLHKRYELEMVIVDYIGRMDTMNAKDNVKEWQLMLNSARMLKTLATELKIVIIMVAQLTRDGGSLAQGSYMKHEADLWLNIWRLKEEEDLAKHYPWNCFVEVKKARNSEAGRLLFMYYNGDTLTFTDKKDEAERYAKINAVEEPL